MCTQWCPRSTQRPPKRTFRMPVEANFLDGVTFMESYYINIYIYICIYGAGPLIPSGEARRGTQKYGGNQKCLESCQKHKNTNFAPVLGPADSIDKGHVTPPPLCLAPRPPLCPAGAGAGPGSGPGLKRTDRSWNQAGRAGPGRASPFCFTEDKKL